LQRLLRSQFGRLLSLMQMEERMRSWRASGRLS